jgi:hypothetical protein
MYDKCDQLTDELIGLERMGDGHIDHTADGINSKDQADAVCGALYLASKFAEEYAYSYGENLDATLEANLSTSQTKTQRIIDFQSELMKAYAATYEELDGLDYAERKKKQEEYDVYRNISDGIIII